jgi:CYTH domain-containing protein
MPAQRDLAAEYASPKYAHIELERRWLAEPDRIPLLDEGRVVLIEDRYIDGTRLRLRRMSRPCGWSSCKLTKKYEADDPAARPVVTAYLTAAEHAVFEALPGRSVVKRRYPAWHGGCEWSLDLFEGALAGLAILEIEAETRATLMALTPPQWTAREITDDPTLQGGSLASLQTVPEDLWHVS